MNPLRVALCSIVLFGTAACGSDPVSPPEASYTIAIHGGADQQGPAGSLLDKPLQVTVTDVANQPVQGVIVRFRVLSGGGSLTDTIGVTGAGGIALTFARVGSAMGPQEYAAQLLRAPERTVTFDATATAPARLLRVNPGSTIAAGDTVSVVGENFNSIPSGNAVFFGSTQARILALEGDTLLRVLVPFCVAAGAIEIRVRVGSAMTNTLPASYSSASPTLVLAVGEGITVGAADLERCLQLPTDAAQRYLIVPQFAGAADDPVSTPFRIGYTEPTLTAAASPNVAWEATVQSGSRPVTAQQRVDAMMRNLEREIAPLVAGQDNEPDAVVLEALELGSTRSFKVISDLGDDGTAPKFGTSKAKLRYLGEHILIYMDERSTATLTDTEMDRIGALFNTRLYDLAVEKFGSESDLDGNGKVIVLMTPFVNGLVTKSQCEAESFVAGYFYPNDLYLRNANSNKGEVFYTIAPDPTATYSCAHSSAFVRRIIPGTFIHEFQHMISFNQHVLARGGSSEDVWLNEGLSLIAEETAGKYFEQLYPVPLGQVFPDSASMFLEDIVVHAYDYISASKAYSVTTFDGFGELEERGAAWLFLRWLGDQKGDEIFARLVQTRATSIENVQSKAGESFAALFGDFSLAVAADVPGFARATLAPRYRFDPRVQASGLVDYQTLFRRIQSKYGRPFPNPVRSSPLAQYSAGSSTQSMVQGTMAFYHLFSTTTLPASVGLVFNHGLGGPLASVLIPQVGIVRVQ